MPQVAMSLEKQPMSVAGSASAPVSPCDEGPSFSEEERKTFLDEDYGAARLVVGIMASVFAVGLALYLFIACVVAMGAD